MKRCFSIALILALLGTTLFSHVFAEELEIISEDIEIPVTEVDMAEPLDISEFPFEEADEAPQQTLSESVEDAPVAEASLDAIVQNTVAEDSVPEEETPKAEALALNKQAIRIGVKEDYDGLVVTALPEGSALPTVKWRSDDKTIAKVSKAGIITGVKAGTTTVYARIAGTKEETACKVTVRKAPKKVIVDAASLTLSPGLTHQIKASVPKNYASGKFTFKSNNKKIARVDSNGLITAVKMGTASITVRSYNKKKAVIKVKVKAAPASVAFPASIVPLAIGQSHTMKASALTKGEAATPAIITYAIDKSSPNPDCVTLNKKTGKVTGVNRGRAIIRGKAHNGAVGYCEVEVDVAPAGISLNNGAATIGVGEVYIGLMATLTPPEGETSCAQSIVWTSSNKKIATVDSVTGAITGVNNGTCTVKAKIPGGQYAKCNVTALKAPKKSKISIYPSNGALKVGQSGQYKITFSDGYGGSLSYESSDTGIATVDNTGIVTAISPGKAVITVTAYNGIQKSANLEVSSATEEKDPDDSKSGNDEKIQYVIKLALEKQGKPYVYGSFGPDSFDCSGFVYWCYKQIGIKLKDSAYKQGYDDSLMKVAYDDLKPGDLVFFNTVDDSDLSDHSALFLGNGKFIHASSSARKVIISTLSSGYYKRNFSWGLRIFG